MAIGLFKFPSGAKVLEITDSSICLEVPDIPEEPPPSPAPMPDGELHPDWRWRRLERMALIEPGASSAPTSPDHDDDRWLRERILPCWRHARDPLLPRGPEQDAYDGAVGLRKLKRFRHPGSMADCFPRLIECGVLAGLEPDRYPGIGPVVPVAERILHELLYFDIRNKRSDRDWIRDAVFLPLCGRPAEHRLELIWKMTAFLLPAAEYLEAVASATPLIGGEAVTPSWLRLQRRLALAESLLESLFRLGVPGTQRVGMLASWLTEPLGDEASEAIWDSLLPPPRKRRTKPSATTSSETPESREAPPGKTVRRRRNPGERFQRLPKNVDAGRLVTEYRQIGERLQRLMAIAVSANED